MHCTTQKKLVFPMAAKTSFVSIILLSIFVMLWVYHHLTVTKIMMTPRQIANNSFVLIVIAVIFSIAIIGEGVSAFAWEEESHLSKRKNIIMYGLCLTVVVIMSIFYLLRDYSVNSYTPYQLVLFIMLGLICVTSLIFHGIAVTVPICECYC